MKKPLLIAAILVLVSITLGAASFIFFADIGASKPASEYGGEFTLQSADGPVSLSDFEGKLVVIYFGFLSCTEACPESMGKINSVFRRLSDEQKAQLQVLFISVDPERDSLANLKKFADYYENGPVIGLTDNQAVIDQISEQYNVLFDLVDLEGSALGYTVDHTSQFYLIDQQGKLIKTMSHTTTANELRAQIEQLL